MTDVSVIPCIADSNSVTASTSNTEEQGATDDVILQQQHQKQGSPEHLLPLDLDQRVVTIVANPVLLSATDEVNEASPFFNSLEDFFILLPIFPADLFTHDEQFGQESGLQNLRPQLVPDLLLDDNGHLSSVLSANSNGRTERGPAMNTGPQQLQPQQQQRQQWQHPLLSARDRLFHALFHRVSLSYARAVPHHFRCVIEWFTLLKAFLCFCILIYVHLVFTQRPSNCLNKIEKEWPRSGILRVEIVRNKPENYTIFNSYKNEYHSFMVDEFLNENGNKDSVSHSHAVEVRSDSNDTRSSEKPSAAVDVERADWSFEANETASDTLEPHADEKLQEQNPLFATLSELEMLLSVVWPEERYVIEYSLEYGLLRLSPKTRQALNVTVMLVTLDPKKDECFGDGFSSFLLDEFLGYDSILMLSIKHLAEKESSEGYLRNVVTGEHYRFVSLWMSKTSCAVASVTMIVFTLAVSMLLRYSHHQIFVFILDLLQMLELNRITSFPAAPLLTVTLALVGMEAIMSEFFNDTKTAFYVMLIVWIADQFDAFCCHTSISKRHWLRFFFLYHFAFYAHHYRFKGQFSGLALLTSWLFIMHSIIYFFHHYELPAILQQSDLQERMNNNRIPAPRLEGTAPASVLVLNRDRNSPEASQNLVTEFHASLQNGEEPRSLQSNSSAVQILTQESNREEQPGDVNSGL